MKIIFRGLLIGLFMMLAFGGSRAFAQTGPDILVKPWADHQAFDISADAIIEQSNPTREDHSSNVQLSIYHTQGRYRILPDVRATPTLGFDLMYVDLTKQDPVLPRHLWNGSIGFAQPVAEINKFFVVLTGAAGYSGDTPFSDPHAAFYTGNLIVGRIFSDDKALVVVLNYDGNRTFLPDTPIPGVEYKDRYNKNLTYVIGFPENSITYEPVNGLQVNVGWDLLQTFSGQVGWEFKKHYFVYGSYTDRLTGFHLSNLPAERRLFLQEHRVEVGFRFNPTKLIRISLGGGWAFGQEFSTGFDSRGINPLRHLRDGAFGRLLLEFGF